MLAQVQYCSLIREKNKRLTKVLVRVLISFILISFLADSTCLAYMVNSRAAVAIDAATGEILFSKNPNRRLPPASTTKLMTAIVTLENEDLSRVVTISKNASHVGSSRAGLREGDKLTIEDLLYAALIKSANEAAVALAEAIAGSEQQFVHLMNEKVISIGAGDTKFINSTGLPGPGQHTTALDLSKILSYAMSNTKLKEIIATRERKIVTEAGKKFLLRSTDKLLWSDERVIGGKTGYTCSAKHCFVCAAQDGTKTIIVALLGSSTRRKLWIETEKLIAWAFHESIE
jgi:D-alanyl-D-alanine carboxypeptidase (penicillin-binding protein 5/6)